MPVVVKSHHSVAELAAGSTADLLRVYADFPGISPQACLATITAALGAGAVFHAGTFNGKHVAGALVSGPVEARRLTLLAVHGATRQRGIGQRLIDEISRMEKTAGAHELSVSVTDLPVGSPMQEQVQEQVARLLTRSGFVPIPDQPGQWRKLLQGTSE